METSELLNTYIYPELSISSLLPELYIKNGLTSHILICPSCSKKEAYIMKKKNTISPYINCNRLNKCGYSSSLWDYIQNRERFTNKETLFYLGFHANVNIDDFSFMKKWKSVKNYIRFTINIVQEPYKLLEIDRYYDLNLLYDSFNSLSRKLQFCAIATFIYNFSLRQSQNQKIAYYRKRAISNISKLGCLNYTDISRLESSLLIYFDLKSLEEFNIFKEGRFKYGFSSFSVVPSFDLYSNLITAIRLRNLNFSKIKEIELSASRVANPLPFGLTKEKLKKYDTFYFTEGHIDALSLNLENFVAIEGVNSFDKKYLGLFKNKRIFIVFDQDKAGEEGAKKLLVFANKLDIKCFIIKWDKTYGKDINELLIHNNMNLMFKASI